MPFEMILPKLLMFTFLLSSLFACNQNPEQSDNFNKTDTSKSDTTKTVFIASTTSTKTPGSSISNKDVEDIIIDTIFKLAESRERAEYIETQTKGKRHLKVWVADTPNLPDKKFYWIKVGEDNGTNFVTHFNFFVYPDSMRIMFYDTQSDIELTLKAWRKINGM